MSYLLEPLITQRNCPSPDGERSFLLISSYADGVLNREDLRRSAAFLVSTAPGRVADISVDAATELMHGCC